MKRYLPLFVLLVVLISCTINTFAQNGSDQDRRWSRPLIDPLNTGVRQHSNWEPAPQIEKHYFINNQDVAVSPNFRPHPTTNTTQSEMSVDVHPTDENIVFGSANASNWPVSTIYGTGVYWSFDGSSTWGGNDTPPFGTNGGDPASVIGANGYLYEAYLIGGSYAIGMAVSTNNGVNWTNHVVNGTANDDKEHLMVDKSPGSPYFNHLYCVWTNFAGNSEVVFRSSSDFGTTWTPLVELSTSVTPGGSSFAQGANVQTGPNGEIYVTYCIYDANFSDGEDGIGFSKSTDGGATWTTLRAYDHLNFGIRGTLSSKGGMRVNSFPSMAVDRSGGPTDGYIYICWPQRNVAPAGSDPDVVMIRSTDGGATWSSPFRVNDDPLSNGKDQIFPWCTVDATTGQLLVVFYDSRNVANNMAEVYMASSYDGGDTFSNFVVSDQSFNFGPISGFAGGYGGDYIGVAAVNDVAYPFWMDSRTGNSQGWMAKVTFGPPCPVEAASNPTPANGATNVPVALSQLTWTNGAGAVTNDLYFGTNPGSLTLEQTGTLATSWNVTGGPLQYATTYYWKVDEVGDTCSQSGPTWSFTTEQDPNLVTAFNEPFDNLSCWTALGPLGTTNWSLNTSNNAGGSPPSELRLSWTPSFDGLSQLISCTINSSSLYLNHVSLKHMCDFYADPAPFMGLAVTYDGGTTSTSLWEFQPVGGSVGPEDINFDFTPTADSYQFILYCNGNSFNINYWYVDDITVTYATPVELSSFNASSNEGTVLLNWSTATETNNRGFEIERKSSNSEYQKIGYVAGFGTTTQPRNYSLHR